MAGVSPGTAGSILACHDIDEGFKSEIGPDSNPSKIYFSPFSYQPPSYLSMLLNRSSRGIVSGVQMAFLLLPPSSLPTPDLQVSRSAGLDFLYSVLRGVGKGQALARSPLCNCKCREIVTALLVEPSLREILLNKMKQFSFA
jgi:hypothetical protein